MKPIRSGQRRSGEREKGEPLHRFGWAAFAAAIATALLAGAAARAAPPGKNHYVVTPLASDVPGLAPVTDANLKNTWGLARGDATHSETWQLRVAPFTRRQIEVGSDGIRAESVTQGDTNELYGTRTRAIYIATSQQLRVARMPKIEIVSKGKLEKLTGSSHVSAAYLMRNGAGAVKVIATRQGATRLREQLARERPQESTGVIPAEFRSEVLSLLRSGRVRVTGHVTVDGRDAIRLESLDGKKVYVVDAATYDPLEWTTTGNGGGVTLRFPVYEQLPADAESLKLLDLQDQHPEAQVVHGANAYTEAEARLYPHG